MNKILKIMLLAIAVGLITVFLNREPTQQTTWEYSYFVQQVENGNVEKVKLSSDRSFAIVTDRDGTRVKVYIPPTEELYVTVTDNIVDISVERQEKEESWFFRGFRVLSSLFLPILILLGLLLLSIAMSSNKK